MEVSTRGELDPALVKFLDRVEEFYGDDCGFVRRIEFQERDEKIEILQWWLTDYGGKDTAQELGYHIMEKWHDWILETECHEYYEVQVIAHGLMLMLVIKWAA